MGVQYREFDVSQDQQAGREMVDLTGQMGVPVIVIDGEYIIGFDRQRIVQLVEAGKNAPPKIRFGLKIADAQKVLEADTAGVVIGGVAPGALGEKAGLKMGDIITRINDRAISGVMDAENVLTNVKPGDIVNFIFLRGGQPGKSEIVV
jgi:S1-C subfamily serine protease